MVEHKRVIVTPSPAAQETMASLEAVERERARLVGKLRGLAAEDFFRVTGFRLGDWALLDGEPALIRHRSSMYDRSTPWLEAYTILKSGKLSLRPKHLYNRWPGRIQPWPEGRPKPQLEKS